MYTEKQFGDTVCHAFSATWNFTHVIQIIFGEKKEIVVKIFV